MELTAIIKYLEYHLGTPCTNDTVVHSDSKYCLGGLVKDVSTTPYSVMKGIDGWIAGWLRKGFKKNPELWKSLNEITVKVIKKSIANGGSLSFRYVQGHAGYLGNERADQLANMGVLKAG